jgi:DNA replication protein DnaC
MTTQNDMVQRARALRLYGLISHLDELWSNPESLAFSKQLLDWEETEARERRQRRLLAATKVGALEGLDSFDWSWPKKIPRDLIEDLFQLKFLEQKANVVFLGTSGLGKTMLAKNLAHEAARAGYTSLFVEAASMLDELLGEAGRAGVERVLRRYAKPRLLVIDEVGYLSYDTRHADLLLRVIQKRHGISSTIITTNRPFSEWGEMFPNASSVVALLDRLTETCELVHIVGDSYRAHKAKMRREEREQRKKTTKTTAVNH